MSYVPQTWTDGSLSTPLSAARLTHIETGIDDADTRLANLFLNVKDYGATGDGVTDDTAAFQAALAAVPASGGLVYAPAGNYVISASLVIPSSTHLRGAGMGATRLTKSGSFPLLKFWGTGTGQPSHLTFSGASDLYLDGNNFTGTMIDMAYCTRLDFYNIHCSRNVDITIDTVEVWDSRFYNVSCDLCGGASTPTVRIGSSRAASGFGLSTDSTNQLMFFGLLVENWKAGAVLLDPGTGGVLLHQIYFFGMKIETSFVHGPAINVSGTTRDIHMDDIWVFMGAFDSGFSTAQNAINVHGDRNINIRGVYMANAGVATIANGFDIWNAGSYIDQAYGSFTTAPTGAMVAVAGGSDYTIGHVVLVGSGTLFSGNMTTSPVVSRPYRAVAGSASDGSFLAPPLVGTPAVDVTNNRLYVKTAAGTWHYTQLDDKPPPDIQVFTTSGTWTKPAGVTTTSIAMIGGGGGGGSGARRISGTATSGGAGGASGGYATQTFRSIDLGATETVTVGAGGAGGTAITVNDTSGNAGTGGSSSLFGTSVRVRASAGGSGGGGTTSASSAGGAGVGSATGGGGGGGNVGAAGTAGSAAGMGSGGGAAGGISATPAAFTGAAGGASAQLGATGGGTAGAIDAAGGAGGAAPTSMSIPGGGGGGGGSSITVTGGAGGAGGLYGAGGGGGGSSLNGQNSGAGGAGAGGIVIVISQ